MSVDTTVQINDAAAKRVAKLLEIEGDYGVRFRVYITGGGCSGFQYGFAFEREMVDDDILIHKSVDHEGTTVDFDIAIDPMSYQYLEGAEIQFVEGLYGAHFKVSNPNTINTQTHTHTKNTH